MLLPDMTSEQMKKVFAEDQREVEHFANRFMTTDGLRALRSHATTFPCTLTRFFDSTVSHQHYLLCWRISQRCEAYGVAKRYYVRAVLHTDYGTEMANQMLDPDTEQLHIVYFRAHLLRRYAERMGLDLNGDELARYFTKRNPMLIEATEWRKDNDVMMLCHDGACFGEIDPEDQMRINLKTFIATDTMNDDTYRSHLNSTFNDAVMNALVNIYSSDPELARFLSKTTKPRKTKNK